MGRRWCEGQNEFRYFDDKEFQDFGGVLVHTAGDWHLVSGIVIEMEGPGRPRLDSYKRPVVLLGELAETARLTPFGDINVAADDNPGDSA